MHTLCLGVEGFFGGEFVKDGFCSCADFFVFPNDTHNFFHFPLAANLIWPKAEASGLCRMHIGDEKMGSTLGTNLEIDSLQDREIPGNHPK